MATSSERLDPSAASAAPAWKLGIGGWAALLLLSALQLVRLLPLALAAWAERVVRRRPRTGDRPRVFIYSQVAWDEVWQRPQEFALALALHADVVFFGPQQIHRRLGPRHRPYRYRQRVASGDAELLAVTPQTFPGTYKKRAIWRLNQLLLRSEAVLACPEPPDLVVVNSPYPSWLRATLRPRRMVFDFIDDFVAFSWSPPWGRACQERLLADTDSLIAGTRYLARRYGSGGRPCEYVASGVDLDRWMAAAQRAAGGLTPPPVLAKFPRPWIGYAGSITDRLDRELLLEVARRFQDGSLVMLGPVHGSFGGELAAPNMHFLGPIPPSELPDWVCRFDVALIPFRLNDATRSLNPIKALEYLAAGRPVVAAPLPDLLEEFGGVVATANDRGAFCDAIARLLAMSDQERADLASKGRAAVAGRTWQRQGEEFVQAVLRTLDEPPRAAAAPKA